MLGVNAVTSLAPYALTLAGGGLLGSWWQFRSGQGALALEREKWEHERAADARQGIREACQTALSSLEELRTLLPPVFEASSPEENQRIVLGLQALIRRSPPILAALTGAQQNDLTGCYLTAVERSMEYLMLTTVGYHPRTGDKAAARAEVSSAILDAMTKARRVVHGL